MSSDLKVLCSFARSENPIFGLFNNGTSKIVKTSLTPSTLILISFAKLSNLLNDSLL